MEENQPRATLFVLADKIGPAGTVPNHAGTTLFGLYDGSFVGKFPCAIRFACYARIVAPVGVKLRAELALETPDRKRLRLPQAGRDVVPMRSVLGTSGVDFWIGEVGLSDISAPGVYRAILLIDGVEKGQWPFVIDLIKSPAAQH
jgi:hypothetical protein